ncbi:class I (W and Y) tRNA synthetase [Helicosporidium sp. ATCC 50920]|nr:class I (W and Y) tRNA synthetase [Helicosporidium sp. ATCC 50920]|eukprot:KDD75145.1 class I (W and Y) tRNA synthetase [Helicosporidium sp. ATCC 50920]
MAEVEKQAPAPSEEAPAEVQTEAMTLLIADMERLMSKDEAECVCGLGEWTLTLEDKFTLCRSVAEECLQDADLRRLLEKKPHIVAYDGFEPSGRMHIAQGVLKALNVNKLTKCGVHFKFWVADWFAQLNNKMGGDLGRIQTVGKYFVEIWRALGMDMRKVEFLQASDHIGADSGAYWSLVMDIARRNSLKRMLRCSQIMGRSESDDLSAAQIFYPCMQCADIFYLRADICQLGMDQRKVNVLAREYAEAARPKRQKPVVLSHPMMPGLLQGQEKMSKSDPNSAIFMEDSEQEVKTKIKKAFCPPQVIEGNPCLAYIQNIVLPWCKRLVIERDEAHGGPRTYTEFHEITEDYASGALHPSDLKPALAKAINEILQPVRDHFVNDPDAAALLKAVKSFKITK